jgi:hypothetical protein
VDRPTHDPANFETAFRVVDGHGGCFDCFADSPSERAAWAAAIRRGQVLAAAARGRIEAEAERRARAGRSAAPGPSTPNSKFRGAGPNWGGTVRSGASSPPSQRFVPGTGVYVSAQRRAAGDPRPPPRQPF